MNLLLVLFRRQAKNDSVGGARCAHSIYFSPFSSCAFIVVLLAQAQQGLTHDKYDATDPGYQVRVPVRSTRGVRPRSHTNIVKVRPTAA
jgi:hypothetical protein